MTTALLCPRDGLVGILSDERAVMQMRDLRESKLVRQISVVEASSRYPDSQWIETESEGQAFDRLRDAMARCQSLDFTLMLLDPRLSTEVRCSAAGILDDLLRVDANRDYVLDIVLAKPVPPLADLSGALELVRHRVRAHELVKLIVDAQPSVASLYKAWLILLSHEDVQQTSPDAINAAFVRFGVHRRLVTKCKSQTDLEEFGRVLSAQPDFVNACDPSILTTFLSEYASSVGKAVEPQRTSAVAEQAKTYDTPRKEQKSHRTTRRKNGAKGERASTTAGKAKGRSIETHGKARRKPQDRHATTKVGVYRVKRFGQDVYEASWTSRTGNRVRVPFSLSEFGGSAFDLACLARQYKSTNRQELLEILTQHDGAVGVDVTQRVNQAKIIGGTTAFGIKLHGGRRVKLRQGGYRMAGSNKKRRSGLQSPLLRKRRG